MWAHMFRKGLILGIVVMFVGASVFPGINGNVKSNVVQKNNKIKFHENFQSNILGGRNPNNWSIETVDYKGWVGEYTSLVLDSNDNPHISYFGNDDLKYAYWTGTSWNIQIVDREGYVGMCNSLALDSNDNPHISYIKGFGFDDLKYAYWMGSSWNIQTLKGEHSYWVGLDTSLALDSSDKPHISFYSINYLSLRYIDWIGTQQRDITVDSNLSIEFDTSLALDSNDKPHISYYYSYDGGNDQLKYAFRPAGSWEIETVDSNINVNTNIDSSLALDGNDNPHIIYTDGFSFKDLKYAYWMGNSWNIQTVDNNVGIDISLALDSNDNPHISYFNAGNGDLKYAYWTGNSWNIQTVDNNVGSTILMYTSLALDSNDNPHISYYDSVDGDLKYAKIGVGNQPPNPPIITGPAKGTIGVTYEYNFTAIDPDGNDVYYFIEWGDSEESGWIGPYSSGEQITKSHNWFIEGTLTFNAKAKDIHNSEGDWASLTITMPCNIIINTPFLQFIEKLFQRFPHTFPILRQLLGY